MLMANRAQTGPMIVASDKGGAVDVVSCHLKSKLLSFPGGRFSPRDEDERVRFGVALNRRAAGSRHGPRLHHPAPGRARPGAGGDRHR
jgi:hypothetical protein